MREAGAAVTMRTYWAWETTATLRLLGSAQGTGAPTGEEMGGGISCRHAHSLYLIYDEAMIREATDNMETGISDSSRLDFGLRVLLTLAYGTLTYQHCSLAAGRHCSTSTSFTRWRLVAADSTVQDRTIPSRR